MRFRKIALALFGCVALGAFAANAAQAAEGDFEAARRAKAMAGLLIDAYR